MEDDLDAEDFIAEKEAEVAPVYIYNKALLLHYANTILPFENDFNETLECSSEALVASTNSAIENDVTTSDEKTTSSSKSTTAGLLNVDDDLKREMAFYAHARSNVLIGKEKLSALNVAYKRPEDYFAEMLKSDAHMAKVKDKLIYESSKMNAVEERKKSVAHKKVAKQVQAAKVKQRMDSKKDTLDAVKQWKKQRGNKNTGLDAQAKEKSDEAALEEILKGSSSAAARRKQRQGAGESDGLTRKTRKRQVKDTKFGYGGPKKLAKQNDSKSTNGSKTLKQSFSRARNNEDVNSAKNKGVKRSGGAADKRPGKASRMKKQRGRAN